MITPTAFFGRLWRTWLNSVAYSSVSLFVGRPHFIMSAQATTGISGKRIRNFREQPSKRTQAWVDLNPPSCQTIEMLFQTYENPVNYHMLTRYLIIIHALFSIITQIFTTPYPVDCSQLLFQDTRHDSHVLPHKLWNNRSSDCVLGTEVYQFFCAFCVLCLLYFFVYRANLCQVSCQAESVSLKLRFASILV